LPEKRLILIVINPAAGKSSYEEKLGILKKTLYDEEIEYELFFTEHGNIGQLASIIKQDPSITEIFVMGGDGTLNYVANEIHGTQLPISIVSNGTGNDSVKSIHGVLDFEEQVQIAIHGKVKAFDLGICNDRYFVNGVGIGFDGEVVKEMVKRGNKHGRHIDYLLTVLRIIAGFKEKELYFSMDEKVFLKKILLMTISNGTTFGGGFIINPFAKTNDGQLDVCIFNEISPLKRFWHLPKLKTGSHTKIKYTEFHLASDIKIKESDELVAHLDGEYIGHPPFNISVSKEALFVRVPA
jgi:YegS/Rv2252/BmrU family lipid kinase